MHRRFRRVLCAVKENCSVGYAKFVTAGGFSDVDFIVIKATAPNDSPLPEKYVQELLKIFAFSPPSYRSFSLCFSRRFRNTRCWRVGLKCLLLLHRLLQSVPENSELRFELLCLRSNGSISLHEHHVREDEDFAYFIRSYARFLDEALNCDSFYHTESPNNSSGNEAIGTIWSKINRVIEISTQIQNLIDRVIDCRPSGRAARSFVVRFAMKHIIREGLICYRTFRRNIDSIDDSVVQLPYRSSIAAIVMYKKAAIQGDRLREIYDWCKANGVCSAYEFSEIDRIPESRIETLEASVGRMWELTESSSSSSTSATSKSSWFASDENVVVRVSSQWENFEGSDYAEKPLMEVEEKEGSRWEEDSASFTWNLWSWDLQSRGRFCKYGTLHFS